MHFDLLVVVTPADCERVLPLYPRVVKNFENGNICFIGTAKVGELAKASVIADRAEWVDENSIISFDDVHSCMTKRLESFLDGKPLPRGITGWYYQQFLKMQYAFICKDDYYMVWDGDTIPCRMIRMFTSDGGQPYFDLKYEYHPEYFETMSKILPGLSKVIEKSFVSEHMLFKKDIMQELISEIESNSDIPGERFWEKIINSISPEKIYDSAFSEFETYGTYVTVRHPDLYQFRDWHSFRLGGSFFNMNTICDRDFRWLAVDFDAISFEKGQSVAKGVGGYFDNPKVQKKISAKKLLQEIQEEFNDAYKEVWEDDLEAAEANYRVGGYYKEKEATPAFKCADPGDNYHGKAGDVVNIPDEWISILFDEEENKRHIVLYCISAAEVVAAGQSGIVHIRKYLDQIENSEEDTLLVMFAPTDLLNFMKMKNPKMANEYELLLKDLENMNRVIFDDNPDSEEIHMVLAVADEFYGDRCKLAEICKERGIPVTIQNYND